MTEKDSFRGFERVE
jgi:hypothetical protein